MVGPGEEGGDERRVRLDDSHGVVREQVDAGQEQLGGELDERPHQRLIDHRTDGDSCRQLAGGRALEDAG